MPEPSTVVDLSLADVLVAGLGAILGWFVASRSYRLDAATAAADWIRDLRAWANEAIDVLAEAAYHSPRGENGPVSDAVLKQCRWQLSALIDRGFDEGIIPQRVHVEFSD